MKNGLSFLALVALVLVWATGSQAQTQTVACSKSDQVMIHDAVASAKGLALSAATAVTDDQRYGHWFGKFSPPNSEHVRATYKAVYEAIRTGAVRVQCESRTSADCDGDTYAFVYGDQPYLVHLCRPFFDLPSMAAMRPMADGSLNGTREGTIIHEITHFHRVSGTDDNCYSRTDCSDMAISNAGLVITNADNYQYFAEDVAFFGGKAAIKAEVAARGAPAVDPTDSK